MAAATTYPSGQRLRPLKPLNSSSAFGGQGAHCASALRCSTCITDSDTTVAVGRRFRSAIEEQRCSPFEPSLATWREPNEH